MKIVVRIPNWIGDVMFSLPALESLKTNFPDGEIWLAAGAWVKDLFSDGAFSSRIIPLEASSRVKDLVPSSRVLKRHNFDAGLLLTNSFSSALLFAMAGIRERWGYRRDGRGLFLTKSVPWNEQSPPPHMVHYYLQLLEGLGLRVLPPEIRIQASAEEKEHALRELRALGADPKNPLIVLHPGAAFGSAKRWPARRFTELVRLLRNIKNADIAITGAPGDADLAEAISSGLSEKPLILAGKTSLRRLIGVISHASVFIANDTGPAHLANALRVPVVAVFGPTDPRATAPFHQPSAVIKKEAIPCWPCFYHQCPYDHGCMMQIAAEDVFKAAAAYLP